MTSNFSENNYSSSCDGSPSQLEIDVDRLMPRLHPSKKYILLKEWPNQKTGAEVARTILHLNGRNDVKVCVNENHRNFYSPFINVVSLSKDVADSRSIVAAATAAHEVAHALQSEFYQKLRRNFSIFTRFPFDYLFLVGNLIIMLIHIIPLMKELQYNQVNNRTQTPDYYSNYVRDKFQEFKQYLKHFKQIGWRQHSIILVMGLRKLGMILLLVIWYVLGSVISCLVFLFFCLLIPLSLFYEFIRRWFIFISELHASWLALRLLKKYKILARRERREARRYLLAAGLTYTEL